MYISDHRLRSAVRVLNAGGLLAHPTEGVWGLACDPLQPHAVLRLCAAKRRDPNKGLILVAAHIDALLPYLHADAQAHLPQAQATWPGPSTWILPAAANLPWWIRGQHRSVAVRVSGHPLVAALCEAFGGALVSTSANISGHPPALHGWQMRAQMRAWVGAVLAGELQTPGQPSAIIDADSGNTLRGKQA